MNELVVISRFTAKPKLVEEVEEALRELASKTQSEDGCLRYAVHQSLDDPATFFVIEKWSDQRDLEEHFLQPYVKALDELIGAYLTGPPDISVAVCLPEGDPAKGTL